MTEPIAEALLTGMEDEAAQASNPAVERCINAFRKSYRASRELKRDAYLAREAGNRAYREAIPHLAGRENIQDFVACVVHGMMAGVFTAVEGSKLLYAAQIAQGFLRGAHSGQEASALPPGIPASV